MSRREHWGWHKATPKKRPPAHGIKVKRFGATWWGQRWIEALERMSPGYSNRLARGRSYARAGRTHDLVVKDGRITAKVTGSRRTPYQVTIALAPLGDGIWEAAIAAMSEKAHFVAELLAGQMPREIDSAFKRCGVSLFPQDEADLVTACSCPDWANPCKHVAATHYVLGAALDRDPFLLFELRGRSKEHVLDALRAARTVEGPARPGRARRGRRSRRKRGQAGRGEVPAMILPALDLADYDELRAPLPRLRLDFEARLMAGNLLRQLGTPAGWDDDASPVDVLGPLVRRAATAARALALADVEPEREPDAKRRAPA
jgi:uncharacterized Zn finger protein